MNRAVIVCFNVGGEPHKISTLIRNRKEVQANGGSGQKARNSLTAMQNGMKQLLALKSL